VSRQESSSCLHGSLLHQSFIQTPISPLNNAAKCHYVHCRDEATEKRQKDLPKIAQQERRSSRVESYQAGISLSRLWQTLPSSVGGVFYFLPLLLQFWWIGKIEYHLVAFVFHFLLGLFVVNMLETGQKSPWQAGTLQQAGHRL